MVRPHSLLLSIALLAALGRSPLPARACTTLAVGGAATADGSIYIT